MKLKQSYSTKKQDMFLEKVLDAYASGTSPRVILKKFGIAKSTFYSWIATFAAEKPSGKPFMPKTIKGPKSVSPEELAALPLEEQVERLKEALVNSELRADLYDEIINVAEAKFNVSIRKKGFIRLSA